MRTLLITAIFFSIFINVSSCARCKGDDVNQGIIVSSFNERCYIGDYGVIIDSRNDADSIFEIYGQCRVDSTFDFNNFTILAYATGGSCNMKTIRTVERNDQQQKYIYTIQVNDCGCFNKKLFNTHNAVVVPKLPAGYTVDFVVLWDE